MYIIAVFLICCHQAHENSKMCRSMYIQAIEPESALHSVQMFSWWPVEAKDRTVLLSLLSASFGSVKPCTYLIAETRVWKWLWVLLCIYSRPAKTWWLHAKNSNCRCGPSSQVSFLFCDNNCFVVCSEFTVNVTCPLWKRSFLFQPSSHFHALWYPSCLQLAGSWVVPWWFISSSPDRSKWLVLNQMPSTCSLGCISSFFNIIFFILQDRRIYNDADRNNLKVKLEYLTTEICLKLIIFNINTVDSIYTLFIYKSRELILPFVSR